MKPALRVLLAVAACSLAPSASSQTAGAPYVPTPTAIVDRMLTLAKIGPGDYVVDLGSGDGRLVTTAVAKYKAKGGMGIDIDPKLVKLANENAAKAGVGDRVRFVEGDLFKADIGEATVVTLYLLPSMLGDVEEKLARELKPGTRVISHDYPLPSWKHVDVVSFDSQEKVAISGTTRTVLLLYRVPAK
jgi:SAM-dependent methyltransferase